MNIEFHKIETPETYPEWLTEEEMITFFHETMKPFEDEPGDIKAALDYMYSKNGGKGGFLMVSRVNGELGGALLMLNTGMGGYVPENILLFVTIDPKLRGQGIGRRMMTDLYRRLQPLDRLSFWTATPAAAEYYRHLGLMSGGRFRLLHSPWQSAGGAKRSLWMLEQDGRGDVCEFVLDDAVCRRIERRAT